MAEKMQVVFVGNVPFDVSEEQLTSIFGEVGPVSSIRMVFDRETGKPKGFGFITYHDRETASSAVRNLNGFEIKGRQLKVDFSDKDPSGPAPPQGQNNDHSSQPAPKRAKTEERPADSTAAIQGYVGSANTQQLLDLFSQIKLLVGTNPISAKQLLQGNPQLTYGLFQAMMTTNIVDASVLQQLLPVIPQQAAPPPQQQHQQNNQQQQYQQQQQQRIDQQQYQQQYPPHHQQQQQQQYPPPQQQGQLPGVDPQQQQLLLQVLALTPAQIAVLPMNQQEDIRLLKSKFGV